MAQPRFSVLGIWRNSAAFQRLGDMAQQRVGDTAQQGFGASAFPFQQMWGNRREDMAERVGDATAGRALGRTAF